MGVVGESLDDIGAGVNELAVQPGDELGMLEHDLGHVGAGLQIAAPLELEQIALGADHRSLVEPFEQPLPSSVGTQFTISFGVDCRCVA